MPDVTSGYAPGPGGLYRLSDRSGPYAVDAAGVATLLTAASAVGAPLPAGTDRSGSITNAGQAQQLAPANSARQSLTGQNTSAGDLWINEIGGTAAIGGAGSYKVQANATFSINTNRAVSIIGATLAQTWAATEV